MTGRYRGSFIWRLLPIAGCVSVALLTGGCSVATGPLEWIQNGFKVGPNYAKPSAPVAEEWIEAKHPNVQDRHLQDWWRVFNDPTLNSLIDKAYAQNLNLRIAGTRVFASPLAASDRGGQPLSANATSDRPI